MSTAIDEIRQSLAYIDTGLKTLNFQKLPLRYLPADVTWEIWAFLDTMSQANFITVNKETYGDFAAETQTVQYWVNFLRFVGQDDPNIESIVKRSIPKLLSTPRATKKQKTDPMLPFSVVKRWGCLISLRLQLYERNLSWKKDKLARVFAEAFAIPLVVSQPVKNEFAIRCLLCQHHILRYCFEQNSRPTFVCSQCRGDPKQIWCMYHPRYKAIWGFSDDIHIPEFERSLQTQYVYYFTQDLIAFRQLIPEFVTPPFAEFIPMMAIPTEQWILLPESVKIHFTCKESTTGSKQQYIKWKTS